MERFTNRHRSRESTWSNDFTNIAAKAVEAVRFIFDVQDTFSEVTQSLGLDWLGTFSPDVAIHAGRNLAGTVGAVNMICSVQDVRFSDGQVWKKGARSTPVTPGVYYPPTRAPNAKPSFISALTLWPTFGPHTPGNRRQHESRT
jgi:hypothetical protein